MVWATANAVRAGWTGAWDATSQDIVQQFKSFVTLIERLDLDVDIDKPPFLDVCAVSAALTPGQSDTSAFINKAIPDPCHNPSSRHGMATRPPRGHQRAVRIMDQTPVDGRVVATAGCGEKEKVEYHVDYDSL